MSQFNSREFKQLQAVYEAKLKESGFNDIEETIGEDRKLKQSAYNAFRGANTIEVQAKLEYFLSVSSYCQNTLFGNFVDRFVMEAYADGIGQAEIRKRLIHAGIKRHRRTIYAIIKNYLIAWGLVDDRNWLQNPANKRKLK